MKKLKIIPAALLCGLLCLCATSDGLNIGDKAPAFSATDDNNATWNSSDVVGKQNLVVFFYPAAMTGGCTKQACAYRDDKQTLDGLNAAVVGISGDKVENLTFFKEAHQLNFPLLSDPEGKIADLFGVPVKKAEKSIVRTINNKEQTLTRTATTSRWTFVIDKEGKVVYKSTQVNASEDSKAVIKALEGL